MGQQAKLMVYIQAEGDAWEILKVRVPDDNLATITIVQDGIDKFGITTVNAQAMIDKAIAMTGRRQ